MSLAIKELDSSQRAELVELFLEIFTGAPWYDVWEDPDRPALYLEELTGSPNSLSLGLYDGSRLIGISLGRILHFAFGTQYCIDEFGIRPDRQGQGAGREFLIENFAHARKIDFLFSDDRPRLSLRKLLPKERFPGTRTQHLLVQGTLKL